MPRPPGCNIEKTMEVEWRKLLPLTSTKSGAFTNKVMSTLNLQVCVVCKMDKRVMKENSGHFK